MTDATELDEAAARARCDAATEGPWFGSGGGRHVYGATPGDEVAECRRRVDADFVRHARTDLPAALDENERLRAALDEAQADLAAETSRADDLNHEVITCDRLDLLARAEAAEKERDEALAEVAEVRYELGDALTTLHAAESALAAAEALAAADPPTAPVGLATSEAALWHVGYVDAQRATLALLASSAPATASEGACAHCGIDDATCSRLCAVGGTNCCEACRSTAGCTHPATGVTSPDEDRPRLCCPSIIGAPHDQDCEHHETTPPASSDGDQGLSS